jgi:ABC-type dipeptide/oligopeptide/nickel transport system permease subunit
MLVLLGLFAVGLLSRHLAPYGYLDVNIDALSVGPSWAHPFGTDQVGRDYFSAVMIGLGTEAKIALIVGLVGSLIGLAAGATAGYFGGVLDNVVMRTTDVFLALPGFVMVLVARTYLHASTPFEVSLVLAAVLWTGVARVVRATCLSLREQEYVEAARAVGAGNTRIILRHVLPNAIGPMAVAASLMTGAAVVAETTLAFLGFGLFRFTAQNRTPSIGDVLANAQNEGLFHWWGVVFPGLTIVVLVSAIIFVGDGIRDALDPAGRTHAGAAGGHRRRLLPRAVSRRLAALPRPQLPHIDLPRLPKPQLRLELPLAERLAARLSRSRRRSGRRRLAFEAIAVLLLSAAAAGAVFAFGIHHVAGRWKVAGSDVQNISRARGAQTEVAVAATPGHPQILFAASNDSLLRTIRVLSSTDGGRAWTSRPGPKLGESCARGEPAVTVAPRGRQYVAFIVNRFCLREDPWPHLIVASRAGPDAPWRSHAMTRLDTNSFDAKPAIAAAADGRVYVAWSHLLRPTYATIVASSSSDGGRTWSPVRVVSPLLVRPQHTTVAVGGHGAVYVAGTDARHGVWAARSVDGGRTFSLHRVAGLPGNPAATCAAAGRFPTATEGNRCVGPNPTIVVTGSRVYVTYSPVKPNGARGVSVATLDATLNPLWRARAGPPEQLKGDQFWPASAVDARTGRLWVCYYDTTGDPSRTRAWFSCAASRDGRSWTTPVRVARAPADASTLWEDARIFGFGDMIGYGGYTGLTVAGGVAHPLWIDTSDPAGRLQEVFGARLAESSVAG